MKSIPSLFIISALLQAASAQNAGIIEKKDVVYGDPASPLHTLDLYASRSAKNAPAVFRIHGGGWQGGMTTSLNTVATPSTCSWAAIQRVGSSRR